MNYNGVCNAAPGFARVCYLDGVAPLTTLGSSIIRFEFKLGPGGFVPSKLPPGAKPKFCRTDWHHRRIFGTFVIDRKYQFLSWRQ